MCRCSKLLLLLLVVVVLVMPVDVGAVVEVEAEMWRWRGTNGGGVEPATLKLRSRGLTGRAGATSSWWRRWNWRTRNHFLDDFNVGKTIIFRLLFRLVLAKIWTVTSGRTFDQIALVFVAVRRRRRLLGVWRRRAAVATAFAGQLADSKARHFAPCKKKKVLKMQHLRISLSLTLLRVAFVLPHEANFKTYKCN